MSDIIKKAVEFAIKTAEDDTFGYDQIKRWGNTDYDCSSLVITSFDVAGLNLRTSGATYTGNMRKVFLSKGFKEVLPLINSVDGSGLEVGDVLLKEGSHTAIYIGDGKIVHASINEKGTAKNGKAGDQTGKEICIRPYYNKYWNSILRYTEPSKHKPAVTIAKEEIAGKWGNGQERRRRLTNAGYNYPTIQAVVNQLLKK